MYCLYDTFNNRVVSRHRTVKAVIRADIRTQLRVTRLSGPSSYLPTELRVINAHGQPVRLSPESPALIEYLYHPLREARL